MATGEERAGSLLIRGVPKENGTIVKVEPTGTDWRYVGFEAVRLSRGGEHTGHTGQCEAALVVVYGIVTVRSGAGVWAEIGERPDPFNGRPCCVYLPPGVEFAVLGHGPAEVAVCTAPATSEYPARLIASHEVSSHTRGKGQATRSINNILMEDAPAGSLLITEVQSPAGNWSSYPPHKHDVDGPPAESQLEETYYFHMNPRQGFAFQRVYTADRTLDQTMTVHDGDLVKVPRGFHVVASAAEYQAYYLNVLAGPRRALRISFDPDHQWIMEGWTW